MRTIKPKAEFYSEPNPLKRIERVARVCWGTEDKITESSAKPFCEKLLKMGHTSPFEHIRVKVPIEKYTGFYNKHPYGFYSRVRFLGNGDYCADMNARDYIAMGGSLDELETLELSDGFATVRFTVDIGISRELCRHRQFSFMERSTRYVNMKYGVDFVLPFPFDWCPETYLEASDPRYGAWWSLCKAAEQSYKTLLKEGCPPQEARSVLPLSTATVLYVTGTYGQWHDMLKLRTATSAHPQMQLAMWLMLDNPDCPKEIREFNENGVEK
jgi:thymidylate synthase (FAD)